MRLKSISVVYRRHVEFAEAGIASGSNATKPPRVKLGMKNRL